MRAAEHIRPVLCFASGPHDQPRRESHENRRRRRVAVAVRRFRATARYRNGFDNAGVDTQASVKAVSGFGSIAHETVLIYFNNSDNIEMMVKMLDQGNTNASGQPTMAVLFGSATPLRAELTIHDTLKGVTKTYSSDFNQMKGATDFAAFVK